MTTPVTLLLLCQAASAVKHTMTFYLMISSGAPNVPDFMIVADFEEVRMAYYDSSMKTPQARHDWVRRLMQDDPQHWERIALDSMRYEQLLKGETESFKQNSSQTGVCFLDSLLVFSVIMYFLLGLLFICCCFCRWFCHWTRWQSGLLEKKDYSPELSGIIVHCVSVFSVSLNIGITCGSDVFTCPASFASTQTTSTEHSLTYYVTTSSGLETFPPFMAVAVVDGVAVGYCDSNNTTAVTKQDWAKEFADKDPQHLQSYSQACKLSVPLSKALIDDLNKHFMKTEGVHVLQEMYGCKWDQGAKTSAHQQFAYDGEDFIRFDLDTASWVYTELATSYKRNWEKYFGFKEDLRRFLTNVCPQRLQQYLRHGLSALQRKVRPSVSLLQTSPSSPVSCHATGFYPDRATMFWRKDGEELHEDVDHGEILPNQDGTFQMTVYLDISSVKPEDWTRYDCVFQLSGAENKTMIKLDKTVIRTNWDTHY
ncbi:hypothetical protein Q5P01_018707 [Channa striata]|uniref:Ig-like domain-containing protein n=1 Tax=Channa striata TaxID=64152 RepID=A0AA88M530_CHASR|nr:hypothetical protein Q5P01_018707 [Channa striata]